MLYSHIPIIAPQGVTTANKVPSTMDRSSALMWMENISKSFPGVRALEDVFLYVDAGEVLGLIGQNGVGK